MVVASAKAGRHVARGKVRDLYEAGPHLLMVASDRISTYDAVHPTPIPGKGVVLTGLSAFWFARTRELCPNHLVSFTDVPSELRGRALLVERLDMVPLECVVRGYLAGSAWAEYRRSGTVCGTALSPGLVEAQALPEPIFTPAYKAADGDHDENLTEDAAAALVGDELLAEVRRLSLALYGLAAAHLRERGILLADTKFEFGRASDGRVVLADEVLTPDSSRLWPATEYRPGGSPPSWDKQFVRDWATASGWDRRPPAPELPPEVVEGTRARYHEAYGRITGEPLEAWLARAEGDRGSADAGVA